VGGLLIGSKTKPSLEVYCQARGIAIDVRFGGEGEKSGSAVGESFMELVPFIEEYLDR
jgi:hypothetical protein